MSRGKPHVEPRARQAAPSAVCESILSFIRVHFYQGEERRFFQDRHFLMRQVVLWPAAWLNKRGVTLQPERYQEVVVFVLREAMTHGAERVKFWPGYLATCMQRHFAAHGEKYYEEGKSMRSALERFAVMLDRTGTVRQPDPVEILAETRRALMAGKPKRVPKTKPAPAAAQQLEFL